MTIHRIPGNLERNPPLVVVSYARWRWLWRVLALLIPVAMVAVTVWELWRETSH